MTAYVLIEGTHESGYPLDPEVHVWYHGNTREGVLNIYKNLYPDKTWEGDTMYRDRQVHSIYGDCHVEHLKVTFHDNPPL